jgi:BlaI family transcriptional regulator, penicillinase repressor
MRGWGLAKKSEIRMGKVQFRIMQVLWEQGELSAREISDAVTATEPISHSTVQTLLRKLEHKGAIRHVERDRVFYFSPAADRTDVTNSTTREFVNRVFEGSASRLVSHLLEHERIPSEEIAELRRMIDEYQEKEK